jgi:hypothetical protein
MDLQLGSEGTLIHDPKFSDVFKKMITLSSALVSYIAQQWLTNAQTATPRGSTVMGSPTTGSPRSARSVSGGS